MRYLLHVWGCVSPYLYGPYETESARDSMVRVALEDCQPEEEYMIGLDVVDGKLVIATEYNLEAVADADCEDGEAAAEARAAERADFVGALFAEPEPGGAT